MSETITCGGCGTDLPSGTTICPDCGWDFTTAVIEKGPRPSLVAMARAGGWRLVVYGALVALAVLGVTRVRTVGPGPDLATTLRWIALGDGGRAAELVTIHRAFEIAGAATRYAVNEMSPPSFEGDWEDMLAPFATMHVRGWMPMLFFGATTDMAPAAVREIFRVRAVDGWGRPYRVTTRALPRGTPWEEDPQVAQDLARGLRVSLFTRDRPDFSDADWLRLQLESAGRDGDLDSDDDLRLVSYLPVGRTLHLSRDPQQIQRELEVAYTLGRHWYHIEGNTWDLIDARLLAEFRAEMLR